MADDDEMEQGDDLEEELEDEDMDADLEAEPDEDFDEDEELAEEDEELADEDEELAEEDEEEDDEDEERPTRARRRKAGEEEEDDDEDLLAPDDVEADLDTILKDRMVASNDEDEDEDEDELDGGDDRGETIDGLQPKRADEILCPSCFLLVRPNAPGCPVGDDDCPIFG